MNKFIGKTSVRKSGNIGIDGHSPEVLVGYPIQVKQSEGIGRNVVDDFGIAMRRTNKKKGYIVAYSFVRARNQDGLEIVLRTAQELMDGKVEEPQREESR